MSKIKIEDFVKNVDFNKQRLINHCKANGKDVSDTDSLDFIVSVNNQIDNTHPNQFKVEFKDLDGNYFAPTQYVSYGGKVEVPTDYPELDSEYLEFVEWVADGDINNVTQNLICLPTYQTKVNEVANQRPTIFKCYFPTDEFNIQLNLAVYENTFINWGDGSEPTQVTSYSNTHKYEKSGFYSIIVYGDNYSGHTSNGFFPQTSAKKCILKVYFGENIKAVSHYCFEGCSALNQVILSNSLTFIGTKAFYMCSSLKTIVIPDSVNTIGTVSQGNASAPFVQCSSLKTVRLPKNLTAIYTYTFYSCHALTNITIPKSVTKIGPGAFGSCYCLNNIVIPMGLTNIENQAFSNCHNLNEIIIPNNVAEIGSVAFSGCSSLSNITLYENFDISSLSFNMFISDDSLIDIANKLKDNSGLSAKTITFSSKLTEYRLNTIYLNADGERVPYKTEGAVSLLGYMQNKNWTVTFGN